LSDLKIVASAAVWLGCRSGCYIIVVRFAPEAAIDAGFSSKSYRQRIALPRLPPHGSSYRL